MSDSLQPRGLQHTRLPCSSPTPGAYSNSCPLSQWCHLILCCPLLLPPSIFPSIRVFHSESVLCIRWPKYWSFSFSISLSNEYSGLISFRMDWVDLLAVQGTLKSLLQHHSSHKSKFLTACYWDVIWLSMLYILTETSNKPNLFITVVFLVVFWWKALIIIKSKTPVKILKW